MSFTVLYVPSRRHEIGASPRFSSLLLKERCAGGFTLVELLTAVGLLAMLFAIVYAVVPSIVQTSRSMKCVNNLRTLGQAFFVYLGEHQQQFPAGYKEPGGWPTELVNAGYVKEDCFRCPSNIENPDTYHGTWSHYGYNYSHLATQIRQTGDLKNRTPASYAQLVSPASTILLIENLRADRMKSSYLLWDAFSTAANEYGNPEPRHRGAFNVLWCDGHVSAVAANTPQAAYSPDVLGSYANPSSKWKVK